VREITIDAPAKINLYLRVLSKRPDGYHKIETLFEKIGLFDRITLKKKRGKTISISSSNRELPATKENIVYKAAELMAAQYKIPLELEIEIEKSIPIASGLGGGSSDAAATLIGIDRLYEMGLRQEELLSLAARLGADCPFFIERSAWAIGSERGDKVEGINSQFKLWHLLIMPKTHLLAKDAYRWVDGQAIKGGAEIDKALSAVKRHDSKALGASLYNSLEGFALEKNETLKGLKRGLYEYGADGALVSGSGPTLFGIAQDEREVMELKRRVEERLTKDRCMWQCLAASTCIT